MPPRLFLEHQITVCPHLQAYPLNTPSEFHPVLLSNNSKCVLSGHHWQKKLEQPAFVKSIFERSLTLQIFQLDERPSLGTCVRNLPRLSSNWMHRLVRWLYLYSVTDILHDVCIMPLGTLTWRHWRRNLTVFSFHAQNSTFSVLLLTENLAKLSVWWFHISFHKRSRYWILTKCNAIFSTSAMHLICCTQWRKIQINAEGNKKKIKGKQWSKWWTDKIQLQPPRKT